MSDISTQPSPEEELTVDSSSTVHNFALPKDYNVYVSLIQDKVNSFLNLNIWEGIDKTVLRKWLKNFSTDEERYFAHCILDHLIYRNDAQTESMLFNLISIDIPNLLLKHKPLDVYPFVTLGGFKNSSEPKVRLVCVKSEFDAPTKSSHFVARMLKRKMMINEKWIITPDQIQLCINSGTKCFIFIDDFLGTGNQFNEMGIEIGLQKMIKNSDLFFAYAPLTAHQFGIQFLNTEYPELKITCVEHLDECNSIFKTAFNDGVNTEESSRAFYMDLMKRKTGSSDGDLLGYGKLELAYAFEQSVPDNNLLLLYWNLNSNINPLFYR